MIELFMRDIITEVINDFLRSKRDMNMNPYSYLDENDLNSIKNCKLTLSEIYDKLLERGLTKNVFLVQQILEVIHKIDKIVKE